MSPKNGRLLVLITVMCLVANMWKTAASIGLLPLRTEEEEAISLAEDRRRLGATDATLLWDFRWETGDVSGGQVKNYGSGAAGTLVGNPPVASSTSPSLFGSGGVYLGAGQYFAPPSLTIEGTAYTFAAWMQIPSATRGSGNMGLFSCGLSTSVITTAQIVHMVSPYGLYLYGEEANNDDIGSRFDMSSAASAGQWFHIAIILGNSAPSCQSMIYINGILAYTFTQGQCYSPLQATRTFPNCYVGTSWWSIGGAEEKFLGSIDDVRLYTRQLSQAEIFSLVTVAPQRAALASFLPSTTNPSGVAISYTQLGTVSLPAQYIVSFDLNPSAAGSTYRGVMFLSGPAGQALPAVYFCPGTSDGTNTASWTCPNLGLHLAFAAGGAPLYLFDQWPLPLDTWSTVTIAVHASRVAFWISGDVFSTPIYSGTISTAGVSAYAATVYAGNPSNAPAEASLRNVVISQSIYTTFLASGSFTPPSTGLYDVLVVAGGGGGGAGHGGGGGAGGVVVHMSQQLSAGQSYPVTVGAGGAGGTSSSSPSTRGSNGANSRFGSTLAAAIGGGGGGTYNVAGNGASGGSGGGGGADVPTNTYLGAAGVSGQGMAGANGCLDTTTGGSGNGGGGGGAGGAGSIAVCIVPGTCSLTNKCGSGGAGGAAVSGLVTWGSLSGLSALGLGVQGFVAGGGGGGAWDTCCGNTAGRAQGGGGGAGYGECCGAVAYGSMKGQSATANTGSGGGGGPDYSHGGGAGGSGFVVVRYSLVQPAPSQSPTGQPTRQPTRQPTGQPSIQPTGQPSRYPSGQPTGQPSRHPSGQPSSYPSSQPTGRPSRQPSSQPSTQPTGQPTKRTPQPSVIPTPAPSPRPTLAPSKAHWMEYLGAHVFYTTFHPGSLCESKPAGLSLKPFRLDDCITENGVTYRLKCFIGPRKASVVQVLYSDDACKTARKRTVLPKNGTVYHVDTCLKQPKLGAPRDYALAKCGDITASLGSRDQLVAQSYLLADLINGTTLPSNSGFLKGGLRDRSETLITFLHTCTQVSAPGSEAIDYYRKVDYVSGDGVTSNLVLQERRYGPKDKCTGLKSLLSNQKIIYLKKGSMGSLQCYPDPLYPASCYVAAVRTLNLLADPAVAVMPRLQTASPTPAPTQPSANPTANPTAIPTTAKPTAVPSPAPTQPSAAPTPTPTAWPTPSPTARPTSAPTAPTRRPTAFPTQPSAAPTLAPTASPTAQPTAIPTDTPTLPRSGEMLDGDALCAFYSTVTNKDALSNWCAKDAAGAYVTAPCSGWTGVTCLSSRVTSLHVGDLALGGGSIPSQLGLIMGLTYFRVDTNGLTGSIPSELGLLTDLTYFNPSVNSLSGTIPSELGMLTKLTVFAVDDNRLSGTIPQAFCSLSTSVYIAVNLGLTFSCP